MRIPRAFLALAMTCCLGAFVSAKEYPPKQWETNLQKALERAAKEDKHILIDFTGSDWCGWCKKLDAEVFSQEAFKEYADKNLVLLYIDFPNGIELSDAQVAQNEKMQQLFQVQGFPTVVMLRPDSTPAMVSGYRKGGPEGYIEYLEEAKGKPLDVPEEIKLEWINALEKHLGVEIPGEVM